MNNEKFLQKYRTNKQAIWVKVKLTNGKEFFFEKYDTWKFIKDTCKRVGVSVERLHLQFRSHEVKVDLSDADGVYFIRSVMGQMGGSSKDYYTVGIIKGDRVNKKMYIIPELIEEKSYEDDIESCFPEGIIYNDQKKRKRTNKSKYKHRSTGDYCTCAALVAEIMCEKNAENKNEGSLPYKFWSRKPWDWTFRRQMIAANKIMKDHKISEAALVRAVLSDDFRGIFSLNHPKAVSVIKKHQLLLDKQTESKQEIKTSKNAKHRDKRFGKKNIFKTLRKFEHGEEEE